MSFHATELSKRYAGTVALEDVSLEVEPGQIVALLGENGAGKSTLSGIVAGSHPATSGTMVWDGEPYAPANPRAANRAGISLIHQELHLLPELSGCGRLDRLGEVGICLQLLEMEVHVRGDLEGDQTLLGVHRGSLAQ